MNGFESNTHALARELVIAAFRMAHEEHMLAMKLGLAKPIDIKPEDIDDPKAAHARDPDGFLERQAISTNATFWWTEMLNDIERIKDRLDRN